MESGIAKAAKSKFGSENEIKCVIDRDSGNIGIFRKLILTEKPENMNLEISLEQAVKIDNENKNKKIGDEILQPLPSFDFGRIAAQTAKQVISFNVFSWDHFIFLNNCFCFSKIYYYIPKF